MLPSRSLCGNLCAESQGIFPQRYLPLHVLSFSVTLIGLLLQTHQRTSVPTRQPASTGVRRVPQLSYTVRR